VSEEKKKKTYTIDSIEVDHYEYEGHLRVRDLELITENRVAVRQEEIERHEMMKAVRAEESERHEMKKIEHSMWKIDMESMLKYRENEMEVRTRWSKASIVQAEAISAIAEVLKAWKK